MFNFLISNVFVQLESTKSFAAPGATGLLGNEGGRQVMPGSKFSACMQRLLKLGGQMSFSRLEKRNEEDHKEHGRLLNRLAAALTKAEKRRKGGAAGCD